MKKNLTNVVGKKLFVISLGGSLINPGEINTAFLRNFKKLIESQIKKGNRFIIITGGGKPARDYQKALTTLGGASFNYLEWMGIYATRLNAQLLRLVFKNLVAPGILDNFITPPKFKNNILVGGGWKPGRSSDGAMIKAAELYGGKTIINLSNVDYVYTKDPRKFKDAKKITNINWRDFRKIVGSKWVPGKNLPFDPTAAKLAQKLGLKVVIANGKNLKNLRALLEGKKFKGTVIQ